MKFRLLAACMVSALLTVVVAPGALAGSNSAGLPLRIGVLDDAPPMGFRDAEGRLSGFSHAIAEAMCQEMKANCTFVVTRLDFLVEELASGVIDIAAVGLLNTPDRRQSILFSQPVYRSITVWLSRPEHPPGRPKVRVSVFRGSVHEHYARTHGWLTVGAQTDGEMLDQMSAGVTQAMVVPLMTSFALQKNPRYLALNLTPSVLQAGELSGDAAFGIRKDRPELKAALDEALENLRRNGTYDRINTLYLPFRVH